MQKTMVLIDVQNVHLGIQACGRTLDWKRFFRYLQDKFQATKVGMFLGYLSQYESFYERLESLGYTLYFKKTARAGNKIKGNVDTLLMLEGLKAYYEEGNTNFMLVSGDGDFDVLVEFWMQKGVFQKLLVPNGQKVSKLLKAIVPRNMILDLSRAERKLKQR